MNSAQITSYPYDLCANNDTIKVASTHCQWYQINLENENLVPWFNLSRNTFNSGDSRNFYYIYSLNNITYSSTGDSNNYTDDEMKLFVNTIIKSYMGANKKPEITNKIYKNQNNLINPNVIEDGGDAGTVGEDNNYTFATNIYDMDAANNEHMKLNAVIVPTSVENKDAFSSDSKYEICKDQDVLYKHSGLDVNLTIPNSYLADNIWNKFKIVVQAEDGNGEPSDIKSFYLSVSTKTKVYHGVFNPDNETANNGIWNDDLIPSYISSSNESEDYYKIVPFASLIHVYNSNISIGLTIDKSFTKTNDGINKISSDGLLENGFCNLIIKYYGKTYNKPTDYDDPLNYLNTIEVFKRDTELNYGYAQINVENKKLSGNLF